MIGMPRYIDVHRILRGIKHRDVKTAHEKGLYVTGSGLVRVPEARLNEIPKVVEEHHKLEAERAMQLARARVSQIR